MVDWPIFAMILFSIACSASAQVTLKHGMAQPVVQQAIAAGNAAGIAQAVLLNVAVIGGLMLYGLSAAMWLFVLAKLDVSVAYPFVGLGFVATMALGCLLFGETLTSRKLIGTLLVVIGVYFVGGSR